MSGKKDSSKIEISKKEFEELQKKADERDEFNEKWLQVHADYENTRKRLEKQKSDYIKFANEEIIAQLFPIMDNFDMAFAAMEKAEDKEAMMEGIRIMEKRRTAKITSSIRIFFCTGATVSSAARSVPTKLLMSRVYTRLSYSSL